MMEDTMPAAGKAQTERKGRLQRAVSLLCGFFISVFLAVFRRRRTEAPTLAAPVGPGAGTEDGSFSRAVIDGLHERIRAQKGRLAFLENVFRSTSDAVIVADLSGKVVMFNKGAENLFEIEEDLALGDNLFRLCTDSTPDGPRIGKMLVENASIENLRAELVGLRGKHTQALLTVNFVKDEDGKPVAIVAVIKDNAELERLYAEVERQRAELEKLTITDALTGLYNRRYFDQKIADEYERMKRGHHDAAAISLLITDIDHFKKFNDGYGHKVGDVALKMVAEAVGRTVRKIDIPCRYGGEEFVVILPGTDERGALALAERIRMAVSEVRVPINGKSLPVTVSIGVRTHRADDVNLTVGMLIHEADMAMYRAKNTGRNRSCAYESMVA